MLQMVIWSTRQEAARRLRAPKLGVLLTCWDELNLNDISPQRLLAQRTPLLEQFIRAKWNQDSYFVLGLSSLERPLDAKLCDDDFINRGPESFGYVVRADGSQCDDLTVPLLQMLQLLDES